MVKTFSRGGNEQLHCKQVPGNPENYTPAVYIEAVRRVLGEIDLDPASRRIAQETVKAKRFFTKEDDGLRQVWTGRVFLNPPYARGVIDRFGNASYRVSRRQSHGGDCLTMLHRYEMVSERPRDVETIGNCWG